MSFDGFDPSAIALLGELPAMSADEFASHKATLTEGVMRPGAELIAAVAGRLDADLTVVSRSSVSPLHRDLRFAAADAPRYKDHLLLTTWEGSDKKTSPMFWIRVDAARVGFASGIGFTPAVRERWRSSVGAAPGEQLARELDRLVAARAADITGDQVRNVPAPFDSDHPRADLLRRTSFQARFVDALPPSIDSPSFADWCVERLDALLPVHRWLRTHLID